jgi:hypothetical protein
MLFSVEKGALSCQISLRDEGPLRRPERASQALGAARVRSGKTGPALGRTGYSTQNVAPAFTM